ncbi:MAG: hypothetical protein ACMUIG_01750 [Thermoplasmatota archaeon]
MSTEKIDAPDKETDRALEDEEELDYDNLREEVHRMASDLGISLDEAARSVYASRGMKPPGRSVRVASISEIDSDMRNITLKARLISVHKGEKHDGEGTYHFGLLGDATSDIRFSAWIDFPYRPGSALIIENASVREWRGRTEVVINRSSAVTVADDQEGLIPELENGLPSMISELAEESRNVDLEGRIIDLKRDSVTVKGVERTVLNGVIADRTGKIEFTCWGPVDLQMDGCYRIIGGYIKSFRGSLKLNFDAGAIIKPVGDSKIPGREDLMKPVNARIIEIERGASHGPVILRGTVVGIRPGSGLIMRCSECGRRIIKGQCPVHGRKDGTEDLQLRAVFDDGSGAAMIRGSRNMVERILGKELSIISDQVVKSMDPDSVERELSELLVGHPVVIIGDISMDEYGVNISPSEIRFGFDADELEGEINSLMEVMV